MPTDTDRKRTRPWLAGLRSSLNHQARAAHDHAEEQALRNQEAFYGELFAFANTRAGLHPGQREALERYFQYVFAQPSWYDDRWKYISTVVVMINTFDTFDP